MLHALEASVGSWISSFPFLGFQAPRVQLLKTSTARSLRKRASLKKQSLPTILQITKVAEISGSKGIIERSLQQRHPRMLKPHHFSLCGGPGHDPQKRGSFHSLHHPSEHKAPGHVIPDQPPRLIAAFGEPLCGNIEQLRATALPPSENLVSRKPGPDGSHHPVLCSGDNLTAWPKNTSLDFKGGTHGKWRKGWDLNPRWELPHVRFRVECLKPSSATLPKTSF